MDGRQCGREWVLVVTVRRLGLENQPSALLRLWGEHVDGRRRGLRRGLPTLKSPLARHGCDFARGSSGRGAGDILGLTGYKVLLLVPWVGH